MSRKLEVAELRKLFLFEALDDDQLAWLAERGVAVRYGGGDVVYHSRVSASHGS